MITSTLRLIGRYIYQVMSETFTIAFFLVDLITFIVSSSFEQIPDPDSWFYIGVAVFGIVAANIRVFHRMEKKIEKLQEEIEQLKAVEANLAVKLLNAQVIPQFMIEARRRAPTTADFQRVPHFNYIYIETEIENIGDKKGKLEVEVLPRESDIPSLFAIHNTTVSFYPNNDPDEWFPDFEKVDNLSWFEGQTHNSIRLIIPLDVENQPEFSTFAHVVDLLDEFKVILRYRTRGIGTYTDWQRVSVMGDFKEYRLKLRRYWFQGLR